MRNQLMARQIPLFLVAFLTVLFFIAGQARVAGAVTVITDIEGRLVKGGSSDVYFVGVDSKRYTFPNEKIFYSWYADFSSVETISDGELALIPMGGIVTYRPGARLVKIPSDARVYAVAADGTLRWVQSEDIASQIFGDNWAKQVDDVIDSLFANFQLGEPIASSNDYTLESGSQETLSTSSNTHTGANTSTTDPADVFKVTSVEVLKVDQHGSPVEDVRSFEFKFNKPPTGIRLTIIEKTTNTTIFSEATGVNDEESTHLLFVPDNWPFKLKPNTTYAWSLVAYAAVNATADETVKANGEFTTDDFYIITETQNNTSSGSSTTPATGVSEAAFKVTSVVVAKTDAQNSPAEDVRSFDIAFSEPAKGVRLMIYEKESGAIFYSQPVNEGKVIESTVRVAPSDWTTKLKPSTVYTWKVVAYSSEKTTSERLVFDIATGEFTTTDFTPVSSANGG